MYIIDKERIKLPSNLGKFAIRVVKIDKIINLKLYKITELYRLN